MFVMTMADSFHIGDTAPVRINGEPATLHYRDPGTLVINGTDARRIVMVDEGTDGAGRPCRTFTCGDQEARMPIYHMEA